MRSGPKCKPTRLHRLQGTYRPHRHGSRLDPEPRGELLAPPKYLSPAQRKRWRQIIAKAPAKLLRSWDESALAGFIIAEEVVIAANIARQAVANDHLLEVNSKGITSLSPLLKLQARYLPIMKQFGELLGFSPVSRASLKDLGEAEVDDSAARRWTSMLEDARRNQVAMKKAYARQQARLTLVEEVTPDADETPETQPAVDGEEQSGESAALPLANPAPPA
jgi:phage terminase small subunit